MAGAITSPSASYAGSAAVTANRFVKLTGDQTVADNDTDGGFCVGVASAPIKTSNVNGVNEVTNGKVIGVWFGDDVCWVEAGAATTRGAECASDSVGRAINAVTGKVVLGRFLKAAANAGELCIVALLGNYVKP